MDIDVLYEVRKDLCWKYVKKYVDEESVNLILYSACLDNFITKKTFWNAAGRLRPDGIFFVRCYPENVSSVISLAVEKGYKYSVIYRDFFLSNKSNIEIYIAIYKNELYKPNIESFLRITNIEDLGENFINLTKFNDTVLFLGDDVLAYVQMAKKLSRYVIAFGQNDLYTNKIVNDGVSKIEL